MAFFSDRIISLIKAVQLKEAWFMTLFIDQVIRNFCIQDKIKNDGIFFSKNDHIKLYSIVWEYPRMLQTKKKNMKTHSFRFSLSIHNDLTLDLQLNQTEQGWHQILLQSLFLLTVLQNQQYFLVLSIRRLKYIIQTSF